MKTIKWNHIVSLLLALCLLCGALTGCAVVPGGNVFVFPTRTLAGTDTYTFGSFTYQLYDDGTAVIIGYSGTETNLTIPDTIDGKTVVAIGEAAFMSNTSIQTLKLNKSLEIIGAYAFCACTSLTTISFSDRLWCIEEFAFDETPWIEAQTDEFVIVGDGVLIRYRGTANDVIIPENVKHIGAAFATNETLTAVEMGENVLTVGDYAFAYTVELRRVVLGENVCRIGASAFDGCTYLPKIVIPDRVESIGEYAFNDCNYLVDVKLGKSVREIGAYAFKYCSRMICLTLPASVETIYGNAFADCYSLALVFYGGTEAQFAALGLDGSNVYLKDAIIQYETTGGLQ